MSLCLYGYCFLETFFLGIIDGFAILILQPQSTDTPTCLRLWVIAEFRLSHFHFTSISHEFSIVLLFSALVSYFLECACSMTRVSFSVYLQERRTLPHYVLHGDTFQNNLACWSCRWSVLCFAVSTLISATVQFQALAETYNSWASLKIVENLSAELLFGGEEVHLVALSMSCNTFSLTIYGMRTSDTWMVSFQSEAYSCRYALRSCRYALCIVYILHVVTKSRFRIDWSVEHCFELFRWISQKVHSMD